MLLGGNGGAVEVVAVLVDLVGLLCCNSKDSIPGTGISVDSCDGGGKKGDTASDSVGGVASGIGGGVGAGG